ncbi:site-specific DNA-methyltransferase [Hymenobacter jeollabukensis]|uniref:site-specific DNA-methyltransferase (adenine-specific) n=1 Tax=Hymenobacter jeollabukensis TaxID=2025313 RepID=A0A5R8WK26_9BACT|nr:site-specific DNA-methyltransferase [Hymenobacter jeollabukensis]TLM88982.1 site-specific DNA-methyltransferase [Hymenobacter jeollabukensis]
MNPITAQDPLARSLDVATDNTQRLQQLFPEAFTEGKVDIDVLRELLGETIDERDEKYGLNWHGKSRARRLALTPSTGTLRPAPEDSVDWETTDNLMLEGDNLEVLKLLQKSYSNQVKLIYIDPPYNTGKDFVYPDNFHDTIRNYQELTGQVEGGKKISSNTETSGRFHTDWLNMMYSRLKLARNLLQDDGAIFISIDDSEVGRLRVICDEIFGEENFVASIIWEKKFAPQNDEKYLSERHDYILAFAKNKPSWNRNLLPRGEEAAARYKNPDNDKRGPWASSDLLRMEHRDNCVYSIKTPAGNSWKPETGTSWRHPEEEMLELINTGQVWFGVDGSSKPRRKRYLSEVSDGVVPETMWFHKDCGHNQEGTQELKALFSDIGIAFSNPKPVRLISRVIEIATNKDDLILDFFVGSGTTAQAVMKANAKDGGNRKFIVVQLPEPLDPNTKEQRDAANSCDSLGKPRTIAELTKERLRRAAKKVKAENPIFSGDLGFRVYKLDSTNIRPWDPNPQDISGSLFAAQEHLKEGRTEHDILTELLLKLGLPLTVPIEERAFGSHTLYAVGAGTLMACLSPRIEKEDVEALAQGMVAWQKELAPVGDSQVVLRDSAFRTDVAKANFTAILEQAGFDKRNIRSL